MIYSSGLLLAFSIFALVSSITPGPNNTMLLISGVNFGFRRSVPHIIGVAVGFAILVTAAGMGLGEVFVKWPVLYTALRYISAIYLIYLAWRILRSKQLQIKEANKKPISFLQAAAFQWANPKAWVMAIIAVTTYIPEEHFLLNLAMLISLFLVFVFLGSIVWTLFGNWIQRFLHRPDYLRLFNVIMATLLILSLYPLFSKNL